MQLDTGIHVSIISSNLIGMQLLDWARRSNRTSSDFGNLIGLNAQGKPAGFAAI